MSETEKVEKVIVLDDEDFSRLVDGEVITFEYPHMESVTLVSERWRGTWESPLHDREENRGTVIFLDEDEDFRQIKYSRTGVCPDGSDVRIAHESKAHLALNDDYKHPDPLNIRNQDKQLDTDN